MTPEESSALSCQQQFELITESNIKINGLSNINETLSVHYLIYRIDNLGNGKHYIGQHHTENPLDNYMGSGNLIIKAVARHGVESFVKTILFDFDNFEEMNEKEKELVPLSACYPYDKMSYNIREGGSHEMAPISKQKLSKSQKHHLRNMDKDKRSKWLKKLSDASSGERNPMYGDFEHTKGFRSENERRKGKSLEEIWGQNKGSKIREKMSIATSGKNNGCYNKRWMIHPLTKDKIYIDKDEVEYYKSLGYVNGTGQQPSKGFRWINNGIQQSQVRPEKLNEYIANGWKIGKLKNTKKLFDPQSGRYKYVKQEEIQKYLDCGYIQKN